MWCHLLAENWTICSLILDCICAAKLNENKAAQFVTVKKKGDVSLVSLPYGDNPASQQK